MEVYHHPKQKRKIQRIFLEFLMIFLAVITGFIAENLRERIADMNGKRNIESIIKSVSIDTSYIKQLYN